MAEPGLGRTAHERAYDLLARKAKRFSSGDEDLSELRNDLALPQFIGLESLECRPLSVTPLNHLSWFRLRRLPSPEDGVRSPLVDGLSAIAAMRSSAALVISGGPTGGLHLGVQRNGLEEWLPTTLAPAVIAEKVASSPPGVSAFVGNDQVWSNGVSFSLSAGSDNAPDQSGLPGLRRLLLASSPSWSIVILLEPVQFAEARAIETALYGSLSALGRLGGTVTHTDNEQDSISRQLPAVDELLEDLKARVDHLRAAESVGLWNTSPYVFSEDGATVEMISGVLGSILQNDPLTSGRWISHSCHVPYGEQSSVPDLPEPVSLLSSADIGVFLETGFGSLPGLEVSEAPPAGRAQPPMSKPIPLGQWAGTSAEVVIDVQDLEGHGFVTGTTGMGKSTTVQKILLELSNKWHIPFLIIDPVKADYEELAPSIDRGLLSVTATDLALNVMQPCEGFSLRTHLEMVSNAFVGSFGFPSPVPYIVAQLFEQMIARSAADPAPTLHDLRDELDPYVASLGYDGEIESNIRASLGLRLSLLLSPAKAERVASPDGRPCLRSILERPAVVQLSTLGDEQERAFLMSMLTIYVAERAHVLGRSNGAVRHVTVLEEAHRILPEPRDSASSEDGNAAGVSAKLLTQMLAEIRSYGESVLVVDQSPAAVARDVLRNTNLKIAHRLPDPDDREVVGGSLGMIEKHYLSLTKLGRGEALMATRRTGEAQLIRIQAAEPDAHGPAPVEFRVNRDDDPRPCCHGRDPGTHHAAEARSREAESVLALALNHMLRTREDRASIWSDADLGLAQLAALDPALTTDSDQAVRCLAWIGFRRAMVRHVAYGSLDSGHLAGRLQRAFEVWEAKGSQQLRLTKRPGDMVGPFHGCRWCSDVCSYRHVAEASTSLGQQSVQTSLRPAWVPVPGMTTVEVMNFWAGQSVKSLTPLLGDEAAVSLARCALVQSAASAGMPAGEQDRLLNDSD
ncbi:ATP-binding protein [Microlunatus capsulatus]|uniref:Helicase HerA central domain-containing protein n=1 Tax=Microlunatus capsulatus TaxID=99117 RepID=A0ABS4Z815_9ACTN|nr:ATP-binding protein [Microlunatus capsulatus]MBP2417187.1 hypothetical protein [Microlunatus capsulatus]